MMAPLASLALLVASAAAPPAPAVAPTPPPPVVRPEVLKQVQAAEALLGDFEEAKALAVLDAVAGGDGITAPEMAQVQLWRGNVLMTLLKPVDASSAFGIARACNPQIEVPATMSPKVRQAFTSARPLECPVASPTPTTAVAAAPAGESKTVAARSGPSPMLLGGAGVAAVGAVLLVLAAAGAVAGVGMVVASFPLLADAQAQESAKDVLQKARQAFGVRVGGLGVLAGAVVVAVAALAAVGGGAVLAFLNRPGE